MGRSGLKQPDMRLWLSYLRSLERQKNSGNIFAFLLVQFQLNTIKMLLGFMHTHGMVMPY